MSNFEISNIDPKKMSDDDLISELEIIGAFVFKGVFELFLMGKIKPDTMTIQQAKKLYQGLEERSDLLLNEILRRRIP